MIKVALFPKLGPPPPPHTMLIQGAHFELTDPTLYGGEGGRNGEIVNKGQVYMTFDQNCRPQGSRLQYERRLHTSA